MLFRTRDRELALEEEERQDEDDNGENDPGRRRVAHFRFAQRLLRGEVEPHEGDEVVLKNDKYPPRCVVISVKRSAPLATVPIVASAK